MCAKRRTNASYYTIPFASQLVALYACSGDAREMPETYEVGVYQDIHDVRDIQRLRGKNVLINGIE